ncbi:hypothetical protein UPYG_G00158430 [Umbra pygmaea]|uniref:Uncharacterized protein n=1 Tax=Umbra pygmaea TaxID=75934 RepID=A0ABD0XNJ7_UMBPY
MMWLLSLLLLHFTLVECFLPAPINVSIVSFNLEHSLTWLSGPGTPLNALYTVQSLNNMSWKTLKHCASLKTNQACDLTNTWKDYFHLYRARVQATTPSQRSNWTLSEVFDPLTDTTLGPPVVFVRGCGNCLILNATHPTSRGTQHLLKLFYMSFTCQVRRTRDGSQFSLTSSGYTVIDYLEPGVEYCITASPAMFLNIHSVPSEPHCAFTSPAPTNTVPVVLSVLCFLLVALFCGFLVYSGLLPRLHGHVLKALLLPMKSTIYSNTIQLH